MRTPRHRATGPSLDVLFVLTILLFVFVFAPGRTAWGDEDRDDVEIVLTEPLPLEDFLSLAGAGSLHLRVADMDYAIAEQDRAALRHFAGKVP